jgi:hypothetical protein
MAEWATAEEITADKLNLRRGFKSRVSAVANIQLNITIADPIALFISQPRILTETMNLIVRHRERARQPRLL